MQNYFSSGSNAIVFSLIGLAVMWLAKIFDDKRTPFDEDQLIVKQKNLAIALRKSGIFLGLAIGLYGVISGPGKGLFADSMTVFWESGFLLTALFAAYLINEHIILSGINNDKAVEENNIAVGLVELGSYVGTGMIINGAFAGEGGGILAAIVFFTLGQIALLLAHFCHKITTLGPYFKEIETKGNVTAAISSMASLIAISIILRASIVGPFTGWENDIKSFVFSFFMGVAILEILGTFVNNAFLPRTSKEICADNNPAAMTILASVKIATALIIASAI